jgi:hypothetical protein
MCNPFLTRLPNSLACTEKQLFDYPRKVSMAGLAGKLGISPATLSEIIRRGTRRLLGVPKIYVC